MADLYRMTVQWTGFAGAPGTTTLYSKAIHVPTSVTTFFNAIKGAFPSTVNWVIPNTGDVLDDATGTLTGAWSAGSSSTVTSSGTGVYAAPVGAIVRYTTSTIVNGRRVRGRMFLVPLLSSVYDAVGTLENANRTTLETAAIALTSAYAGNLVVWHRPSDAGPGSSAIVTGTTVPDKVCTLRSRRD